MKKQENKYYSKIRKLGRVFRFGDWFPPLMFLFIFLYTWEIGVKLFKIPNYLIPPPSDIWRFIKANIDAILYDTGITMFESVAGFIIGSTFGFFVSIGFAHSKLMEKTVYPYMIALKAIPIVALAPLLVLWFGNGIYGKVVMSSLICFFPVIVNSTVGLKAVQQSELDLFKSFAATKLQIFWKLRLPNSLPYLFSALKIASTLSVVGAIVGEFSGAKSGLGYMMIIAIYQLETEALYSGIIITSIAGILFFRLISLIEKKLIHWKSDSSNF